MIDGKPRQVMLSVRELNTESMPNRSWVNERLTFTHGYGLTLGPVNQVTTEGLPVLFVRDIPPVSTVDLQGRPAERLLTGSCRTPTRSSRRRQPEFHYPRGEATARPRRRRHGLRDDVLRRVGRRAGGLVPAPADVRHPVRQHGHSRQQPDHAATAGSCSTGEIDERVRELAPFLTYDADPYPVLSGGRMYWMQDAYTTTDRYPYSTPRLASQRRRSTTSATP